MSGLQAKMLVPRGGSFHLDLELSVEAGRTVVLLGPSGAGKSTVVSTLAGLLALEDGIIRIGEVTLDDPGHRVFVPPEERRVGVVFQDYLLFPHLGVIDNVAFGLRSRGVGHDEARRRAGEWLERLRLSGLADRRPRDLSGGQAQRVALARALAAQPALLLLDEPLSALDATTRPALRRTLAEHLRGFAGPRLLITHDPEEAFLLADQIVVVEGGAMTQMGTPDEIRLRPRSGYAADVGGANLFAGTAAGGMVRVGAHVLHVVDRHLSGPVLVTIRPSSVALHVERPSGSPRNVWPTTVDLIERRGETVRLQVGPPLPLTVEITESAAASLSLAMGTTVWAAVKATDISVRSDAGS